MLNGTIGGRSESVRWFRGGLTRWIFVIELSRLRIGTRSPIGYRRRLYFARKQPADTDLPARVPSYRLGAVRGSASLYLNTRA